MAGDLGISEMLFSSAGGESAGRTMAAGGPVIHDYGARVKIGLGGSDSIAGSPINEDALTMSEKLGLTAFRSRLSDAYKRSKSARPLQSAGWGGSGGSPLLHADQQFMIRGAPVAEDDSAVADAPEARRLAGRIAVGLVLVSGPGSLAMSGAQQQKIVAEVQNGLSYLGSQAPAKDVTFAYDIQLAQIAAADTSGAPPPGTDANGRYEFFERTWRDPALAALNYPAGSAGIRQYIRHIKSEKRADAAYCAFFTHYKLEHFGYCSGSYLTMHYDNDGWGVENLDRVFAHETGHIFGAPDEYAESNCNCRGSWGAYGKPNLNCENCAEDGGVDCIMKRNSWAMCDHTLYHLGYTMTDV